MGLNNYKLKNIPVSKIGISPIYKDVIDSDEIVDYKRKHEITELEILNFIIPASVLQQKDTYVLISGISTFVAFRDSGSLHIKARVLSAASEMEKMLCVLHDIMSLIRLLPLAAKKKNRLKDQLYAFIKKNTDAVKAFSLINNELNSFSRILKHYDSSYRSAHFEHKRNNRARGQFKLSGKWFNYDCGIVCFEIENLNLNGLSIEQNGFTQKLIFEQRSDKSYDAKADYLTDKHLFRFRIMQPVAHLANIGDSLIYFNDAEKTVIEIVIGKEKTRHIQLEVQPRTRGYFLTEQSTVKYLIDIVDDKFIIKTPSSNNAIRMKKCSIAVLPVE